MLLIGIAGSELTCQERDWLQNDAVAGVVLFKRNFVSRQQVTQLCVSIRESVKRPLLLAVDQEGGRVQRFDAGYSLLSPLQHLGDLYTQNPQTALEKTQQHAELMASEIRATGLDLSFAPVADLACGNKAIGNRAFSANPHSTAKLVSAYIQGMHNAGMPATLKHFPGHGTVLEDTHINNAEDKRSLEELEKTDLLPFRAGIKAGADAVMMAHAVYPNIAPEPAGYSAYWIKHLLCEKMGFKGVIFSDDIGMAAAFSAGGVGARVKAHLDAGCDVVLVCHPELVENALQSVTRRTLNNVGVLALMAHGANAWQRFIADNPPIKNNIFHNQSIV